MDTLTDTPPHRADVPITVKPRMEFIDAMRGGACLSVVLYHAFGGWTALNIEPSVWRHQSPMENLFTAAKVAASIGYLGVPLFLCLSGLCLFLPCVNKYDVNEVHVNFWDFMKRRSRRILPPYYVAMVVFLILIKLNDIHVIRGLPESIGPKWSILLHLLMLYNFSPDTVNAICPAFWSLAVEYQIYLIFPLLLWLVRRTGLRGLLVAAFTIAIAWGRYAVLHYKGSSVAYFCTPFDFCWYFVVGMVCAAVIASPAYVRLQKPMMLVAGLTAPAALIYTYGPMPYFEKDILWGVVFGGLIIALSRVDVNVFYKNLICKGLFRMGVFSYSVYLIHLALVQFFMAHDFNVMNIVLAVVSSLGVGWLFHIAFERPFMSSQAKRSPARP